MTITRTTATCFSIDELKEYLSGWSDDARVADIETHLLVCSDCERALRELESKPDTLLQSLQGTEVAGSRSERDRATEAAIEKAKRLMDVPVVTAEDKNRAAWQPTNRELGVYELLKPLGRGGMGAVYLANHRQLKKQVAIKLLPILSAEDNDVRARFQREIRVVGRLNHPSIVAATDAGEIDGTQFLVMEYVSGLDLSRLARLLGKLPVADACELIRQVALGLSCAHAEGVVHRDVKPSNLMLDETGHIRIMDFGLAQLSFWDEASVDLTTVGQLMGTLDYMAPEQAEFGGNVDYRADLYALGATLFRLLCGRPPLAAAPNQSPLEKLRLLANHQSPKLDTLCPEAPAELVTLVGALLSRSPQDRPASAAHVAEQLAGFTESADLVGLLKRAQDKAAESPELLKPEKPRFEKGVWNSPASVVGTGEGMPPKFQTPFSGRISRWFIAAALPLMIVAGIFIKLETDKGQLVIESDIDNIKVQIASDGKLVSGLTISHGTTATRLRADKYEVTIDGPSDGLTIENEQFTIKNGETVVARIQMRSNPSIEATSSEPVIRREKTLDQAGIRRSATRLSEHLKTFSGRMPLSLLIQMADSKNSVKIAEDLSSRVDYLLDCVDQKDSEQEVVKHLAGIEVQGRMFLQDFTDLPSESAQAIMTDIEIELKNLRIASLGSNTQPSTESHASPANNLSAEPLYEGKTLSEWLDMLERERSSTGLISALGACEALVSPETSERITQTILKVMPRLNEYRNLNLLPVQENTTTTFDSAAMQVLWKANSGSAYFQLWVKEIETTDENWRGRLWSYARHNIRGNPELVETVEPLIKWAEEQWGSADALASQSEADTLETANLLREIICTEPACDDEQFVRRVVQLLKACPRIDTAWWLSRPVGFIEFDGPEIKPSIAGIVPLHAEVALRAISVLEDPQSSESLVGQAAMILSNAPSLTPEQKSRILIDVNRRLVEAANSPELLIRMVDFAGSFWQLVLPNVKAENRNGVLVRPAFGQIDWQASTSGNVRASVTHELLDLFQALKSDSTPTDGLAAVTKSLANLELPNLKGWVHNMKWPELQVSPNSGQRNPRPGVQLEDLSPDEVLKVVLHEHPALVEYRYSLTTDETDEGAKVPVP